MDLANGKQPPRTLWLLALLALGSSAFLLFWFGELEFSLTGLIISSGLVGLLALSPIPVGGREAVLAHSLSLATALYFGPQEAVAALFLGLLTGEIGRGFIENSRFRWIHWQARLDAFLSSYCQHTFSLALGLFAFQAAGGSLPIGSAGSTPALPYIVLGISFILPFLATQWLQEFGEVRTNLSFTEAFTFIVVIGFIPIPYSILTAEAAASLGETALVIFGGGPAVIAPIVRGLLVAERDLERRLDELSTLGEVSQAMRTSLNLEAILHTIYLQVAHLLEVRNFFVALYDAQNESLTYPLAIKAGTRQSWPSRPISDRLTDRVITTGQPLLIPKNAPTVLRQMGMPELENAPEAWLGVPLQVPDRTLGCLGVFHLETGEFDEEAKKLLITIAGQASVAIENAMLYDQTRQRAHALASLNEISTQMSSSLDPEQTLRMVARSLIRVIEGKAAAIYLLDGEGTNLELAQSTGLPEPFKDKNSKVPLSEYEMTEAFHTGKPVLIDRDGSLNRSTSKQDLLPEASFSTRLDLPLITPSGPLGIASVFFSTPTALGDEQLELLETFVAQSALAVANARAHAATDQALKRQVDQLSRLETIGRDMVSTLDPEDLFEVVLDSALEATGAPIGYLALASSDSFDLKLVAHHGFNLNDKYRQGGELSAEQFGLAGKSFLEGQSIIADDVRQMPEHVDWTHGGTGSLLAVPIKRWGRTLGVLAVEKDQSNAFSAEEPRFLAQVASYAAVAITNATLYQQLEDNLREQSLLFQASAQITTSMDLKSVAFAVADSLVVSIEASVAAVYSLHHRTRELTKLADVANTTTNPNILENVLHSGMESLREAVTTGVPSHHELRTNGAGFTAMAIPLQVGAQSIGAIQVVFESPHTFSEAEIRTTQTIASQAAVAIQNTDLFRRIRESRDRLDAVINSTKEGILMVDQDGKILLVNRPFESLLGVEASKIVGEGLLSDVSDLAEKLHLPIDQEQSNSVPILSSLEVKSTPTIVQVDSPQNRVLERMVRKVLDTAGNRIGWLVILRDVSEERELEEAREQLVEMIVHDLRSPLSTIKGAISLLNRSLPEERRSEVTAQALTVSDRAVNQMLGLVNALLDLARLQNDPLEIKSQPVDISRMLKLLAETYIPEANEAGLILNLDIPNQLPLVRADEDKLRRVLSNLLDNAIKFTPDGGTIELSAESNGDNEILLSVADDGPGVPEELRERIFDRFAQVPGVAGRRRGTGLGLAFAKLAIEAHGGQIWVESNNGQGACFVIRLPMGKANQASQE